MPNDKQQLHKESIKYLTTAPLRENDPKFICAISDVAYEFLTTDEVGLIEQLYFKMKIIALRNKILYGLIRCRHLELKDFFQKAYKKERYLDKRLLAIHGLVQYAPEEEIEKVTDHFLKILIKRPETTPYNYYEYEFLRSAFGFPLLIKKYGYSCFEKVYQQVEKQYQDMPEAFRGHFTFDENGKQVSLRTPMKIKQMIDRFYESRNLR
ncbi:hypothetical protein J2W97_003778 [Paenibacillus jamilae]|uniref:hypothetical protein n=1 Tax=Paenibacillus TaxID=44249 RepID=UPI000D2F5949|nr:MULTISPECIES: hypothetical protein [Paenibacillus]MDP9677768.1 hypothetical protein [Paenibacillus jamilae]KAF6621546.1 hypothetical protein HFE00_02605 [Paenibacillus sp. EKM101P]KAF6622851.1 hypothetical protein HFE03_12070 [Paenibacillus sp. EKM102P]KAF6632704.1 hypothetical protein HFE01_12110 [Paenibacillus sp. EKM10P]KAF6647455.1 hypothetical protein HFE02_14165 [Paenibacillus sp. EKM11P]